MPSPFLETFWQYSLAIIPWFLIGSLIAYFLELRLHKQALSKHLQTLRLRNILSAQALGMISPLSVMSALPVAGEFIDLGANATLLLTFLVAERSYDLQSLFILSSLFGVRFAVLNMLAIFLSLTAASLVLSLHPITFTQKRDGKASGFWTRQLRTFLVVLVGIGVGALLHTLVPPQVFQHYAHTTFGGILSGTLFGFVLYFGTILGNYPVAKAFSDLGMSSAGVFAFLTVSPVFNLVIIFLFTSVIKARIILKMFAVYAVTALLLSFLFPAFL
ncbi:MAG: hypothetical protein A2785_04115 [Candidatus Chisholmbacteria bacterium RIFCSPHIGHO2_01_FULL_49_18]|uniref:Permease n=2 Tax=Candidatus Chisholmiibacteriota TaxID=1817900 RepID=A0A1G1VPA3_9BACT|nr:MAG: hypothetical protein A2785_04115 [Candidatus Chisholmbacteria bacterium RIFCSPHIGHO2_01_FULL_49_18]OGY22510.1 MAG: hypothetical protein A3A65_00780 [Candidatus Chisholmbacteria bacterium RIFCSPLOWO2_01_FULL_49_14]